MTPQGREVEDLEREGPHEDRQDDPQDREDVQLEREGPHEDRQDDPKTMRMTIWNARAHTRIARMTSETARMYIWSARMATTTRRSAARSREARRGHCGVQDGRGAIQLLGRAVELLLELHVRALFLVLVEGLLLSGLSCPDPCP